MSEYIKEAGGIINKIIDNINNSSINTQIEYAPGYPKVITTFNKDLCTYLLSEYDKRTKNVRKTKEYNISCNSY